MQQGIIQQLPTGELVQRPLSADGGDVQTVVLSQPGVSTSISNPVISSAPRFGTQPTS